MFIALNNCFHVKLDEIVFEIFGKIEFWVEKSLFVGCRRTREGVACVSWEMRQLLDIVLKLVDLLV